MMGFKLVLALLSALLVHDVCEAGKGFGGFGGFGGAGNIILINQQRLKLVVAQKAVTAAIDAANTTIQNNIATAQASIDQEVLDSQNKAQAVTNQACVDQHTAALSQVNSESVKACDEADQLDAVENKVSLLAFYHTKISAGYSMCPAFPPTTCSVAEYLDVIDKEITDHQTKIEEDVAKAKADSDQCVKDATTAAHNAIVASDNALRDCVSSTTAT